MAAKFQYVGGGEIVDPSGPAPVGARLAGTTRYVTRLPLFLDGRYYGASAANPLVFDTDADPNPEWEPVTDAVGLVFSEAQVLAATGISETILDFGEDGRDLGSGEMLRAVIEILAKSGTAPTLSLQIVGSSDAELINDRVIVCALGLLSDPAVPFLIEAPIATHTACRHFGVEYTLDGTEPSFTVNARLVKYFETLKQL